MTDAMEQHPMTTVLLVDDQYELRAIHGAFLTSNGFHVLMAEDGDGALYAAREHHPDVILLDHSLPRLSGLEVARELKRDPATADIPIVMLTAHTYGAVGRRARAVGCAGFLSKPCGPQRVLQEIRRHLADDPL
jgi:two-component system, cell cycle response regulator DivK